MNMLGFLFGFLIGIFGLVYFVKSLAEFKKYYVKEENGNEID